MALKAYAAEVAQQYGINPAIFTRQLDQESGFRNGLTSSAGAQGVGQFMPKTAAAYGVDVNDPYSSIDGAGRMMRDLLEANGGDYARALAAYNAGQGNLNKYGLEGVLSSSFANGETQKYVSNILGQESGVTDYESKSDDELVKEALGGGSPSQAGAIPVGFSYDPNTDTYYMAGPNGTKRPVGLEEVQAAYLAQMRASKSIDRAGTPAAAKQVTTDDRTGEAVIFDPTTGGFRRTGEQLGYGSVDPRETAQATEQDRAATREQTSRDQAIELFKQSQNALLTASRDAETGKNNRGTLKESARATDLNAAVDQYKTAIGLIPLLGQLSLEESKRVQDILSNGGDFLARAFETRGGTSPLAKVTNADQINAVSGAIGQLREMINTTIAASPMAKGGGFSGMEAYQGADLSQAPAVPGYTDPGQYKFSGAPAVAPAPAGGFAQSGAASAPAENGYAPTPFTPSSSKVSPAAYTGVQMDTAPAHGDFSGNQPRPPQPPADSVGFDDWAKRWADPTGMIPGLAPRPSIGDTAKRFLDPTGILPGMAPGPDQTFKKIFGGFIDRLPGFAEGGFTREARMIVGDQVSGQPTGHEEMVVNPTNAPIAIIPDPPISNAPRFATGTIDSISNTGVDVQGGVPTGQTGSLPGGGYYYNNANGTSGVNANTSMGAFSGFLNTGHSREDAQKMSGFDPDAYSKSMETTDMAGMGPRGTTQADLVRMSRANMPPAVAAVLNGQSVPARMAPKSAVGGAPLRPFTARQLASLDSGELKALGTATNVEYNAGLPYISELAASTYGPSRQRRGGFVGAM